MYHLGEIVCDFDVFRIQSSFERSIVEPARKVLSVYYLLNENTECYISSIMANSFSDGEEITIKVKIEKDKVNIGRCKRIGMDDFLMDFTKNSQIINEKLKTVLTDELERTSDITKGGTYSYSYRDSLTYPNIVVFGDLGDDDRSPSVRQEIVVVLRATIIDQRLHDQERGPIK